jgi:hypothetical protein
VSFHDAGRERDLLGNSEGSFSRRVPRRRA